MCGCEERRNGGTEGRTEAAEATGGGRRAFGSRQPVARPPSSAVVRRHRHTLRPLFTTTISRARRISAAPSCHALQQGPLVPPLLGPTRAGAHLFRLPPFLCVGADPVGAISLRLFGSIQLRLPFSSLPPSPSTCWHDHDAAVTTSRRAPQCPRCRWQHAPDPPESHPARAWSALQYPCVWAKARGKWEGKRKREKEQCGRDHWHRC